MAQAPVDPQAGEAPGAPGQEHLQWDTSGLRSSYCNVANAAASREELVFNFGVTLDTDRPNAELAVELRHRVILSPFAAKRLQELLIKVIKEYESGHGEVK